MRKAQLLRNKIVLINTDTLQIKTTYIPSLLLMANPVNLAFDPQKKCKRKVDDYNILKKIIKH